MEAATAGEGIGLEEREVEVGKVRELARTPFPVALAALLPLLPLPAPLPLSLLPPLEALFTALPPHGLPLSPLPLPLLLPLLPTLPPPPLPTPLPLPPLLLPMLPPLLAPPLLPLRAPLLPRALTLSRLLTGRKAGHQAHRGTLFDTGQVTALRGGMGSRGETGVSG